MAIRSLPPCRTTCTCRPSGFVDDDQVFYRIDTVDAAGNVTAVRTAARRLDAGTGPPIDVWYGGTQRTGHLGRVQGDFNVLGKIPEMDRLVSMTYSLNGAPPTDLSVGGAATASATGAVWETRATSTRTSRSTHCRSARTRSRC